MKIALKTVMASLIIPCLLVAVEITKADGLVATGGNITTNGGYRIHTFTNSGTFEVTAGSGAVELLIVAGGGSGGNSVGGGGGGGGVVSTSVLVSISSVDIVVGIGGQKVIDWNSKGTDGSNSLFGALIAYGGGAGGNLALPAVSPGNNGGSGGGGAKEYAPGQGVIGQGHDGGQSWSDKTGGGGGGGSNVGGNGSIESGGNGGAGFMSDISGITSCYGGGGAGGSNGDGGGGIGGQGGVGGGGNGASSLTVQPAQDGTNNYGGGGGGGTWNPKQNGGNGGSGIVIVRYLISTPAAPEGLNASDGTYTDKVRITWSAASGAAGYQVFRYTSNNSSSADQIGSTTSTTYDDLSAAEDTTYYYWVKATNAAGVSAFSSYDTGYLAPTVATLTAPTGVSASDGTYSNKVVVTWNMVNGALNYELWRNTSNNTASASVLAQTTNVATYDDLAVGEGLTYYYWVKAKNAQATSEFSSPDSGYISYTPPTPAGNADLSLMTLLFLPATLTTNQHPGAVSVQLINYGQMNLTSPNTRVAIDLYISANGTFGDGDDISLGDYTSDQAVDASTYTTVVVPASGRAGLTVPMTTTAGTYNVFARARHAYPSTLVDPDESNNYVMREGVITVVTNSSGGGDTDTGYHLINDYDGDGKSDLALYQESTGKWDVMLSGSGYQKTSIVFGGSGYEPVLADYDGDGKSDPAVYQESTGTWKVMMSKQSYAVQTMEFGGSGYTPVPADFDGDGLADPIVYQESTGTWIILPSGSAYVGMTVELGGNGYKAVPADYDGDGKSDIAVYRRSTGDWYFKLSTLDYFTMSVQFGGSGRLPVPADFDGDGKADPAVYKEASGEWNVMMTKYSYMIAQAFHGGNGYVAVPADYDGDGKGDVVVYNESAAVLKILLSGSGYALTVVEGIGGPGYDPVGVVK
jgi:hypothetical protein